MKIQGNGENSQGKHGKIHGKKRVGIPRKSGTFPEKKRGKFHEKRVKIPGKKGGKSWKKWGKIHGKFRKKKR